MSIVFFFIIFILSQVTVKIKDDNPRPFFNFPSVTVNIQEHTNIEDGKLGTVTAYDRRDGVIQSCDCTYSLDTKRGTYEDMNIDIPTKLYNKLFGITLLLYFSKHWVHVCLFKSQSDSSCVL